MRGPPKECHRDAHRPGLADARPPRVSHQPVSGAYCIGGISQAYATLRADQCMLLLRTRPPTYLRLVFWVTMIWCSGVLVSCLQTHPDICRYLSLPMHSL